MDYLNKNKPQNQTWISKKVNHDETPIQITENDIDNNEFSINNYNNLSIFKQKFKDTQLKNISINFGFPNTLNSYDYQNKVDLIENPMFEQKNYFYYDKNFQLFKNKSVSRYGDKKNKKGKNVVQKSNKNRLYSPQHKIITSIKKKKYLDDSAQCELNKKQKTAKKEIDVYELEVINQVLYNDEDSQGKSKKSGKETLSSKSEKDSDNDNEWGEIEQAVFENQNDNKDIKDKNLLNSFCIEIEKENGDKQLKYVEISKDENGLPDDPCLKIKYTLEDKISLNSATPQKTQSLIKQKDFSKHKSPYNKKYTENAYGTNSNISLRRENACEVFLKESKSTQNILSSSDGKEKTFDSGSTKQSSQKYSKYSNAMNNLNYKKNIDQIKPIRLDEQEEIEFNNKYINTSTNNNLTKKIIGQTKEEKKALSPDKVPNLKYNRSSYDAKENKKKKRK